MMYSKSARASAGRSAYLRRSSLSTTMNGPPPTPPIALASDAVPSRTRRPNDVIGREVPGRAPAMAAATPALVPPREAEEPGRALPVPGRANPVVGRPDADVGRTLALSPPPAAPVIGRESDVPGRGMEAVALSSSSTSATPSSSTSTSSTQLSSVSARVLRYHAAWSYGCASSSCEHSAAVAA